MIGSTGRNDFEVLRVDESGNVTCVAGFGRFDLALRYAQEIAESIARNDFDRIRRGVECSGTRGLIVPGWDVWEIVHSSVTPVFHPISSCFKGPSAMVEALRTLGARPQ